MDIIIPQMTRKGMNRGAFGSRLLCPGLVKGENNHPEVCKAEKWQYVDRISTYRVRYKCKVCGKTIQYDYSNNLEHPYAVFGKNKWQRIVEEAKRHGKGKRPLGED